MVKKSIMFSILFLLVLLSCTKPLLARGELPFIMLENVKLVLINSTQKDIEAALGSPSKMEYFEKGTEEFNWNNFSVAYYEDGHLYFHYSENKRLIRISVSNEYSKSIRTQFGLIDKVTKEDIERALNNSTVNNLVQEGNSVTYTQRIKENEIIYTTIWFSENQKVKWYDVYFENTI